MTLLIVSPMHDEAEHVEALAAMLRAQTWQDFDWVAVDDGSRDGTAERLVAAAGDEFVRVLTKANDGGLIGGSAYTSWRSGVELMLAEKDYSHVMKLDADVRLAPDYLERVVALATGDVGIAGGVIVSSGMREQKFHVPGPVKLYTAAGYRATRSMPATIGFDVLDEMAVAERGMRTAVDADARFELSRPIGASEGRIHGRYRNGRVSRWTGYSFPYFLAHVGRYVVRRPYVIGAVAMLWGYVSAGVGPYDLELRRAHARMQRAKLRSALRNPAAFWRAAYAVGPPEPTGASS